MTKQWQIAAVNESTTSKKWQIAIVDENGNKITDPEVLDAVITQVFPRVLEQIGQANTAMVSSEAHDDYSIKVTCSICERVGYMNETPRTDVPLTCGPCAFRVLTTETVNA